MQIIKRFRIGRLPIVLAAAVACNSPIHGAILAAWNFNSPSPDADASTGTLQPATGSGTAALVGGVTATFTASNGSSDLNVTDNSNWRITGWPAQGTQNKQNGVGFAVSTAGHRKIQVQWDIRASNTASKYVRLQYTTNGADYVDFQVLNLAAETWLNSQVASLTAVPGVDDNPNFGVRFVTEFASSAAGLDPVGYVPCSGTNVYGSAGTLRFDMVQVTGQPLPITSLTLLTYNVLGRGVTDWTTNNPQVQAIGRQLTYLRPDIIGFQEIPEINANYRQMTNFVAAYLPGYHLAIGTYSDGAERSAVVSRFPITRSKSWLVGSSLVPFGYNGTYSRDLFEAEIEVPGFPYPFHFLNAHLKAGNDEPSAAMRGAEARAISNFIVTAFLTTNSLRSYCLVGDFNEDIFRPRQFEQQAIQSLASLRTGLRLITPRNPITANDCTWSTRNASLSIRFDYLLPTALLSSNVIGGQVFRSELVDPMPPSIQPTDSVTASDHLPVLIVVRNPYLAPVRIKSLGITNEIAYLCWPTLPGVRYRVETGNSVESWAPAVTNFIGAGGDVSLQFPATAPSRLFRVGIEP